MDWKYYDPVFECDEYNRDMLRYSPWSDHRLFAYDLVANLKPATIVELGSFYGCSTFAFAQAVKDLHLETVIWGVDIWAPFDEFTKSDYREDVYGAFCRVCSNCFEQRYVKMLRMPFDQALERFEPNSIDILHIDGSHYYEDVKHDYNAWREKMSKDGIMLFHDIADVKINGMVMGSHVFWGEIKKTEPYTMQFDYSCGLGVLFLSEDIYRKTVAAIDPGHYQKEAESAAVQMKDEIRKMSFIIRDNDNYIQDLREQVAEKDRHLNSYKINTEQVKTSYEATIAEKDQYIAELEERPAKVEAELKKDYEATIAEKDRYILELEERPAKVEAELKTSYEATIAEKDRYISELEERPARVEAELKTSYEATIAEKDRYISELEERPAKVEAELKKDYEATIAEKGRYISELEGRPAKVEAELKMSYEATIAEKDWYISELEDRFRHTETELTSWAREKDEYIQDLEAQIKIKDHHLERYRSDMERLKADYEKTIVEKDEYIAQLLEETKE